MKKEIQNQNGFSMLEFVMVFTILAFLVAGIIGARSLVESSNVSNAQNLTSNSPVFNIDGLSFWAETSMTTVNSKVKDNVNTLEDLGPNKLDLTQGSMSKVPEYMKSEILKGLKTLKFDGNNACLASKPINTIKYSVFLVLNADKAKATDVIVQNGKLAGGWEIKGSEIAIGTRILTVTNSLTERKIYKNNSVPSTGSAINATEFDGFFTVGCGNGSNGFEGEIAEIIIFNRVLFSREIEEIQNYLEKKYSLNYN